MPISVPKIVCDDIRDIYSFKLEGFDEDDEVLS